MVTRVAHVSHSGGNATSHLTPPGVLQPLQVDHSSQSEQTNVVKRVGQLTCLGNVAVPTLYLLGCNLCSTPAMGSLLFQAGAVSSSRSRGDVSLEAMEIHAVDGPCGPGQGCMPFASAQRARWASRFVHPCDSSNTTYTDMSSNLFSKARLPTALRDLYGSQAGSLSLVLLIREPLRRMQSAFYRLHADSWAEGDFQRLVRSLRNASTKPESPDTETGIGSLPLNYEGVLLNRPRLARWAEGGEARCWYNSMYSLLLEGWLENFHPRQFVVLPNKWALTHTREAVGLIASLGAALSPELVDTEVRSTLGSLTDRSRNDHPPIEADLDADAADWLRNTYFVPDFDRLTGQLVAGAADGLKLGGLSTPRPSRDTVKDHFANNW